MTRQILILHAIVWLAITLHAAETPVVTLDPHNILVDHFMGLGVQIDPFEY